MPPSKQLRLTYLAQATKGKQRGGCRTFARLQTKLRMIVDLVFFHALGYFSFAYNTKALASRVLILLL